MPNKKKTVQQREEELAQRIMDDVNSGMDARFARFEQLFERLAPPPEAPAQRHIPPAEPAVTRSKKRTADALSSPTEPPTPAKVSRKPAKKPSNQTSHSTFDDNCDSSEPRPSRTPARSTRQSPQAPPRHPINSFAECPATRSDVNRRDPRAGADFHQTYQRNKEPGISNTWAAWSTAHDGSDRPTSHLPVSTHNIPYDDMVDSQVKQILATTVHNLGKSNSQPFDFPYKYISRGPEKIKASLNSVTLPEHLWGIFRMIHDHKTIQDIKPCLILHVEQIVEDARDFEWESGVRRWSEEVFSRIAEGRLVHGWHSTDEIQRMRMILAQSKPLQARQAPQNFQRENYGRRFTSQSQTQPQNEILKGGPPCPDFNSATGCTLKSGHIRDGKRLVHVCSFCLLNTSATNTHPEAHCRNKLRLTSTTHHF